ncbi:hypothetical protein PanWU01x14_214680 [Parasponia andersonii]|uniref:Uncharacterized protein n=1 Tax=Parasponia andersonii TaxID=3476 RepID=A0A2P5BS81_PARAD|nr:hypothetical protein PanWU01x14_214680 [Parasponia andersonii]
MHIPAARTHSRLNPSVGSSDFPLIASNPILRPNSQEIFVPPNVILANAQKEDLAARVHLGAVLVVP